MNIVLKKDTIVLDMRTTLPNTGGGFLKALFGSKLRVRLLTHLFRHSQEAFYVRELERAISVPVSALARELKRLEGAGLLTSESIGRHRFYRLRADAPGIAELRQLFTLVDDALQQLANALSGIPGIELALVFGSYASGAPRAYSDIDALIIGSVSERDIAPVVAKVERHLGREVNYHLLTREEARAELEQGNGFLSAVLEGPVVLLRGGKNDELLRAS